MPGLSRIPFSQSFASPFSTLTFLISQAMSPFNTLPAPPLPPQLLPSLASAGLTMLHHVASWTSSHASSILPMLQICPDLPQLLRYTAAFPHLATFTLWLSSLFLASLTHNQPSLTFPPHLRQQVAEEDLLALATSSAAPCLPPSSHISASDASMVPSPASTLAFHTVTFTASSLSHAFCRSPAYFGRSATRRSRRYHPCPLVQQGR